MHNVSQAEIDHKLAELDNDPAVISFLGDYPNMHTKLAYVRGLAEYFRWLDSQGLVMTPTQLLQDNLNCVFKSEATDTATKAKHTRLLKTFINTFLFQKGCADSKRSLERSMWNWSNCWVRVGSGPRRTWVFRLPRQWGDSHSICKYFHSKLRFGLGVDMAVDPCPCHLACLWYPRHESRRLSRCEQPPS